ncbi:hypothetical protein BD779DRAFT_1089608 [Infundibulicybe gibba]|nr:hypothetical protein BD779DRAFT_1089608 [Infundibulicybe gibba]
MVAWLSYLLVLGTIAVQLELFDLVGKANRKPTSDLFLPQERVMVTQRRCRGGGRPALDMMGGWTYRGSPLHHPAP